MPPRTIDQLIAALDIEGEIAARAIVAEIGGCGAAAVAPLRQAIRQHRSARVRRWSCEALALLIGVEAFADLAAAARDPQMSVRLHALIALSGLPDRRVAPVLVELIADPSGGIRGNAVVAAREHLADDAVLRAVIAAGDDATWYVRKEVAVALRGHPDPAARRVRERLCADAHPAVRNAAATEAPPPA